MPGVFIPLKKSNMEPFPQGAGLFPLTAGQQWKEFKGILRLKIERTVIACSGSLHTESKDPVVQDPWNK